MVHLGRTFLVAAAFSGCSLAKPLARRGLLDYIKTDVNALATAVKETLATNKTEATIDPSYLPDLDYFAQYAAAAYCDPNNIVGNQVACGNSVCPDVETNDVTTISVFDTAGDADTTGIVARDDTTQTIVVTFRGSSSIENWIANLDFGFKDVDDWCSGCKVHEGFYNAYEDDAQTIRDAVASESASYPSYKIVVTGHSLGGALATICATDLRLQGHTVTAYTYGAPRIGNEALSDFITNAGTIFRVTHLNDPVPRLPPLVFDFVHVSPEYWISAGDSNIPASAIDVLPGSINYGGNTGQGLTLNTTAHLHYLLANEVEISACV